MSKIIKQDDYIGIKLVHESDKSFSVIQYDWFGQISAKRFGLIEQKAARDYYNKIHSSLVSLEGLLNG